MNVRGASAYADASTMERITDEQARFFHEKGFLVVRNLIGKDELEKLQQETLALIKQRNKGADFWFNDEIPDSWYTNYKDSPNNSVQADKSKGEVKRGTPFRIEYPVDKLASCVSLLGHPFLLRSIEKLQGPNFIPTWDSLVFKEEGDGVPIKWHRDASAESIGGKFALPQPRGSTVTNPGSNVCPPPVDVGIYLDEASVKLGNCLYVIPGSNFWPDQLAATMTSHLTDNGFRTSGAIPVEVGPGDMIMHNILVLHGSPACNAPLRRTVYYEFRAIESELAHGPHTPSYIPLKQRVLLACIGRRAAQRPQETSYKYNPDAQYAITAPYEENTTFRYPHEEHFLKTYRG